MSSKLDHESAGHANPHLPCFEFLPVGKIFCGVTGPFLDLFLGVGKVVALGCVLCGDVGRDPSGMSDEVDCFGSGLGHLSEDLNTSRAIANDCNLLARVVERSVPEEE